MKPRLRAVPGFPGIYAATDGTVWSLRRFEGSSHYGAVRWNGWRQLPQPADSDGYPRVAVARPETARGRGYVTVHRLVALAFLGPRPEWAVCTHLDGNKRNNTPANLAYRTQKENISDKYTHGTMPTGERHPASRLSDEQCVQLIQLAKAGVRRRDLAQRFSVSLPLVDKILSGRTRPHLQQPLH